MEIIVHAGLKKTGSTAVQVFLDEQARCLMDHDWYVPKASFAPTPTLRTSGNAYPLALAAEAGAAEEVRTFLRTQLTAAHEAHCRCLVLSCETLCALPEPSWRLLAQELLATDCPCTFLVFEREPYAWYFSTWLQAIKRDGCQTWLDTTLERNTEAFLRPLLAPAILAALPRDRFATLAIDYDANRHDVVGAFIRALGLPVAPPPPRRYNRSISAAEVFLFYALNKATDGNMALCQSLCDKYLVGDGDREPFFFFDPAVNDAIHAFLLAHGVVRPQAAYPQAPRLTEAAFLEQCGPLAATYAGILGDAVGFYRDFSQSVAARAMHKARHFAHSPARQLVPADFDILCYLIANPDVLFADCDPYRHFLDLGRAEGRTYSI